MTETHSPAERWRYLANVRQGIISKLEKRIVRLEAEAAGLRMQLTAANARLAMYDQREAA